MKLADRPVVIGGVKKTVKEACRECGIELKLVRYRLRREWPLEKAVTTPKHTVNWRDAPETINGVTRTRGEWCELYGKKEKLVRNRTQQLGWDFYTALSAADTKGAGTFIKVCGVAKSKEGWAKELGVSAHAIRNMMSDRAISFPAAVRVILGNRLLMETLTATIDGETRSLREWAKIYGTPEKSVIMRIEREVAREECVIPPAEYTKLLRKRANERRYARDHGESAEAPRRADREFIEFCLKCEKPARKCRGRVTDCIREKLIREYLGK